MRETGPFSHVTLGRESKTILLPAQLAAFAVIATLLTYSAIRLHVQNRRSWDEIVVRLSPAWTCSSAGPSNADADPWVLFRDAGVMAEMAHYAARNARDFDLATIEELRSNAFVMRIIALQALARGALIRRTA